MASNAADEEVGKGGPAETAVPSAEVETNIENEAGPSAGEVISNETLEVRVRELEREIGGLRSTIGERSQEVEALKWEIAKAAIRYRAALLAAVPEVPEELVQGQTVEELDASLASARRVVEKIAGQLESQAAAQRVPSGVPPRRGPDLGALSPREKILYALQKR